MVIYGDIKVYVDLKNLCKIKKAYDLSVLNYLING